MEKWPEGLSPRQLAHWLNEQYGAETLMHLLKMTVVEVGPERAVVEMPVHPGLYTPHHYIHAGVMVSLADTAATLAQWRRTGVIWILSSFRSRFPFPARSFPTSARVCWSPKRRFLIPAGR